MTSHYNTSKENGNVGVVSIPIMANLDRRLTVDQYRVLIAIYSLMDYPAVPVIATCNDIAARIGIGWTGNSMIVAKARSGLVKLGWLKIGEGVDLVTRSYQITLPELFREA